MPLFKPFKASINAARTPSAGGQYKKLAGRPDEEPRRESSNKIDTNRTYGSLLKSADNTGEFAALAAMAAIAYLQGTTWRSTPFVRVITIGLYYSTLIVIPAHVLRRLCTRLYSRSNGSSSPCKRLTNVITRVFTWHNVRNAVCWFYKRPSDKQSVDPRPSDVSLPAI